MKKNILFCGTPEFAVSSLNTLFKYQSSLNYKLVGVITIPDKIAGRGHKLQESAVKTEAKKLKLPIYESDNLSDEKFIDKIKKLTLDLIIVVAFKKLPKILFEIPKLGTINLHASLLPKYRGAAPINWAIINGEKETGLTTFFINEFIDTGDIILQSKVKIPINWHANDLYATLMKQSQYIIKETIKKVFSEKYKLIKQESNQESKAPKINKKNRTLNIEKFSKNDKSKKIYDFIRGMSPPGVKTQISIQKKGNTIVKNILITKVGNFQKTNNNLQKNQRIILKNKVDKLFIMSKYDSFQIEKLKLENGKEIFAKEFINGFIKKDSINISIG